MYRILLVEKSNVVSDLLGNLFEDQLLIKSFSDIDEALKSIEDINPELVILTDEMDENELLNFCQTIRQRYSLVLPVLMIVNFYSSMNTEQFKNSGVNFIVKPFSRKEFKEKVEYFLFQEKLTKVNVSSIEESENELINKFRPYIKQEVQTEIYSIFKQLLEGMEQNRVKERVVNQ